MFSLLILLLSSVRAHLICVSVFGMSENENLIEECTATGNSCLSKYLPHCTSVVIQMPAEPIVPWDWAISGLGPGARVSAPNIKLTL